VNDPREATQCNNRKHESNLGHFDACPDSGHNGATILSRRSAATKVIVFEVVYGSIGPAAKPHYRPTATRTRRKRGEIPALASQLKTLGRWGKLDGKAAYENFSEKAERVMAYTLLFASRLTATPCRRSNPRIGDRSPWIEIIHRPAKKLLLKLRARLRCGTQAAYRHRRDHFFVGTASTSTALDRHEGSHPLRSHIIVPCEVREPGAVAILHHAAIFFPGSRSASRAGRNVGSRAVIHRAFLEHVVDGSQDGGERP
jgi:hypothetical protein